MNTLRSNTIALASSDEDLKHLSPELVGHLFDIVWDLHEGFDGEEVDEPYLLHIMAIRYVRRGLQPAHVIGSGT